MGHPSWIPLSDLLRTHRGADFRADALAGLTVGVLLIPQGIAYAGLAGLPPAYGLFAAMVPLVVYALLGTSRQLSVGPVAVISLLVGTGLSEMASPGTQAYVALALLLAFLVGLVSVAAGLLRLGFLSSFLSRPVIHGFTAAAAVLIISTQLGPLLGITVPSSAQLHGTLQALIPELPNAHLMTCCIGGGALAIVTVARRVHRAAPGPLLAVALATGVSALLGAERAGVAVIGSVDAGLPRLRLHALSADQVADLLPLALAIAFLGFLGSYAAARAMELKEGERRMRPNRELVALGAANLVGSLFGAYPVAGGFGRTAVNQQAGARSGLASLISAGVVALALLLLMPLLHHLPRAALAAIIIAAVARLVDVSYARALWRTDKRDLATFAVTFIGTLGLGVEPGIAIAIVMSLLLVLYGVSTPHSALLGRLPGSRHYMNVERFSEAETRPDVVVLRFDAPLFFGNARLLEERVIATCGECSGERKLFVLDAGAISSMDSTALAVLSDVVARCKTQDVTFCLAHARGPVRDILTRSGVLEIIGKDQCFLSVADAVDWFDQAQQRG